MPLRSLTVDLARGHARQLLPAEVERDYLGGRGAIAWLLWYQLEPDTPPLSANNLLIFATGPLAGSSGYATGGFTVGTRSPLTGGIAYGWAPGHWGAALRRNNVDVLIIRGEAPDWCYLLIDGDTVRLRSARHLVGRDTVATAATLSAELGGDVRVLAIGPAGEVGVAYASIVAEGQYLVEPAGTGAVMADKKLKAIVVRDRAPLPVADVARMQSVLQSIQQRGERHPTANAIRAIGSAGLLPAAIKLGALTSRDARTPADGVAIARMFSEIARRGGRQERGCAGCPLPCYIDLRTRTGETHPLPSLELIAGFGARVGITDADTMLAIADRCLRLGIDPAAAAAAITFMTEAQDEGLVRQRTLNWGDGAAVIAALDRMSQRQEKRDILSLGVGEMQEAVWGSAAFAPQVKGLAMPALDPRALTEIGLAMATSPIGGDYRYAMAFEELVAEPPAWLPPPASGPRETEGKALRLIWHERFAAVLDASGLCRRLGLMAYQVTPGELIALLSAVSGRTISGADLVRIGERIVTLDRMFTRRYAANSQDTLPDRYLREPLSSGPTAGYTPPLDVLLAEYYARHGWDSAGDPTPARLAELGIP
ncbi:aldehyde ferredoxin oxidoreductase C-terminal domain-containing protein [Chloroflexus aggregans]|uniref:Aldehyde ferredoxin oxidoreductase n=1 Tax=Chloroflexus aggregans (strain MD-66 / DSM 9485) TaxID=326427 RepID=B8GD84_CHLAD|nr:aldehyde ferredoxin oxidoreductase C-terminal domain-containing protein [Chloroflexus aggregans]ACL25151.1 Aldehyde ferredoxin oxidoreductase [Chloroflexus aggregans DSM 9485]